MTESPVIPDGLVAKRYTCMKCGAATTIPLAEIWTTGAPATFRARHTHDRLLGQHYVMIDDILDTKAVL